MEYKNLQRAVCLAHDLPILDKARKALADEQATIRIVTPSSGEIITLPASVRLNVINILNAEYNRARKEVETL